MSDFTSKGFFQPVIPNHLLTREDKKFIAMFGVTSFPDGDGVRLFADGDCDHAICEDKENNPKELEEGDLIARLQDIICRSNGELPWISKETALLCSSPRADGFGGTAIFITADDVQYLSTSSWLQERISEAETGDFGPGADDAPSEKPIIGIILQGGLVQCVVSNAPELIDADVVVIDYDSEGADEDELMTVPQSDGTETEAVGHREEIAPTDIDLKGILSHLKHGTVKIAAVSISAGENAVEVIDGTMKKWRVSVTRTAYSTKEFDVEAVEEWSAKEQALELAGDTIFDTDSADYEVVSAVRVESNL